ncbi:MAG TPA: hypothetical protein VIT65_20055 [Microlunatus sp.]
MPTTRPRHVITETDPVAAALDEAARRWPEDSQSRSRLLLRLVEEGHHAIAADSARRLAARVEAIRRTSASLSGVYGPTYLDDVRRDWDE